MTLYGTLRRRLAPELENSQFAYARRLQDLTEGATRWLDVGCGHSVVPDWIGRATPVLARRPFGIDADFNALRQHRQLAGGVLGDAQVLPFRDGAFDLITANMVLEHIERPERLFREMGRVLAPGGRILVHTPNLSGYTTRLTRLSPRRLRPWIAAVLHGRAAQDVYPTFYQANTAPALAALATTGGLELDSCEYALTSPQLIRVPPLLVAEMFWIRHISQPQRARHRPVLIAVLTRRRQGGERPV